MKFKVWLLGVLAAMAFLVGYGTMAKAVYPTFYDGYFDNRRDTNGGQLVWYNTDGTPGCEGGAYQGSTAPDKTLAIPNWVIADYPSNYNPEEKANRFVNFVLCKLGGSNREKTGAAFIISIMIGKNTTRNPSQADKDDFRKRVNAAATNGLVNFMLASLPCSAYTKNGVSMNTYYQNNGNNDIATLDDCGTVNKPAIVFYNTDGSPRFILKRYCANPVGDMLPLQQGDFHLEATVGIETSDGDRVVQQGEQVTFRYRVANTGELNSSSASCSIAGTQPSGTSGPPGTNCPRVFTHGQTVDVTSSPEVITISTQSAGSQICRTLTATPGSSSGGTATSGQQCVVVAKTPYVHFKGGDIWVGGGFAGSDGACTTNSNANVVTSSSQSSSAGSAVEYASFVLGTVTRFGSGNKALYSSADFSDLGRRLSFSNNTTTIGRFGAAQHCIDDRSADYVAAPPINGAINLQDQPDNGKWHATGDLTIYGTLPAGYRQVYLVDGNVTINDAGGSNDFIRYKSASTANPSYNNTNEIPSLVVIAKGDIRIDAAVTDIAGIFISRGTFYTCYPKPSPPTASTCAKQLTINGSVIASTLDLYRTYGASGSTVAARQVPAEIFNLSPEIFLNNVLNTDAISTSDFRELPPRF